MCGTNKPGITYYFVADRCMDSYNIVQACTTCACKHAKYYDYCPKHNY